MCFSACYAIAVVERHRVEATGTLRLIWLAEFNGGIMRVVAGVGRNLWADSLVVGCSSAHSI